MEAMGAHRTKLLAETEGALQKMEAVMAESQIVADVTGHIRLEVDWNEKKKHVSVRVIDGNKLPAADSNGLSDPYVKIWMHKGLGGERVNKSKKKTSVMHKTLNPVWNETLIMPGVTTDTIDSLFFHIEVSLCFDVLPCRRLCGQVRGGGMWRW